MTKEKIIDVLIIGGGPAGLSAAIYARRAELSVAIIEKGLPGGQIFQTSNIENYPGGIAGESGADFSMRLYEHALSFGPELINAEVSSISTDGDIKVIHTEAGEFYAKTIIIATGSNPIPLGVKGEAEFTGRGISYCATCDGPLYKGVDVFVVGGGDSAVEESLHLAKLARHVTLIHRRDELRAAKSLVTKAEGMGNIDFLLDSIVEELKGDSILKSIIVKNVKTNSTNIIKLPKGDPKMGVFIFVGMRPNTDFLGDLLDLDNGYVLTDADMQTNIEGIFAAGDVRQKELRQVVTATADGAIAATSAEKLLR